MVFEARKSDTNLFHYTICSGVPPSHRPQQTQTVQIPLLRLCWGQLYALGTQEVVPESTGQHHLLHRLVFSYNLPPRKAMRIPSIVYNQNMDASNRQRTMIPSAGTLQTTKPRMFSSMFYWLSWLNKYAFVSRWRRSKSTTKSGKNTLALEWLTHWSWVIQIGAN